MHVEKTVKEVAPVLKGQAQTQQKVEEAANIDNTVKKQDNKTAEEKSSLEKAKANRAKLENNIEAYKKAGKLDQPVMEQLLEKIGIALGLTKKDSNSLTDFYFYRDGIKSDDSINEKVKRDYKGDFSKLKDITGGTFVISEDKIKSAFNNILAMNVLDIYESKPPKSKKGYWDYKITYYLPHGSIGELITLTPYMYEMKETIGHPIYEITRSIAAAFELENDGELTITDEQRNFLIMIRKEANDLMTAIYSDKNWSFDSISKALSLFISKFDSGRVLVNGLTDKLSEALSTANVTKLGLELDHANKIRLSPSSGSQTVKETNLSNSDLLNIKSSTDSITETSEAGKEQTKSPTPAKKQAVVETKANTKTFRDVAKVIADNAEKEGERLVEEQNKKAEAIASEAKLISLKDINDQRKNSKTGNINEMDTSHIMTKSEIDKADGDIQQYLTRTGQLADGEKIGRLTPKGSYEAGLSSDKLLATVSKHVFNGISLSNKKI